MDIPPRLQEPLAQVQRKLSSAVASAVRFYKANTTVVLSAFTIASVLLIFWARLGFTLDMNRFFAAQPGQLTIQCGATQNVLTWTHDDRANSNRIERGNIGAKNLPSCADYWCWLPSTTFVHQVPQPNTPASYTDNQLQSGTCYEYRVKYQPNLTSNSVFCPQNCDLASPSPTSVPTTTPSSTPTPSATTTPSPSLSPSPSTTASPSPTSTPTPSVTASPTATPTPTPSPTPVPLGVLGVVMSGKNISTNGAESSSIEMRTGQQAHVTLRVRNTASQGNLTSVFARVQLPPGLSYLPGTTTIRSIPLSGDALAIENIPLGLLAPNQEVIVEFRVTAVAAQFTSGATQLQIGAQLQAVGVPGASAALNVLVNKPADATTGTVATGPGDALLAAFLVSSIITLLYVSYTHTSAFRRREVGSITEEKTPLDFRS